MSFVIPRIYQNNLKKHLKDTLFPSLMSFLVKRQKYTEGIIEFPQNTIFTINNIHIYSAICTFQMLKSSTNNHSCLTYT